MDRDPCAIIPISSRTLLSSRASDLLAARSRSVRELVIEENKIPRPPFAGQIFARLAGKLAPAVGPRQRKPGPVTQKAPAAAQAAAAQAAAASSRATRRAPRAPPPGHKSRARRAPESLHAPSRARFPARSLCCRQRGILASIGRPVCVRPPAWAHSISAPILPRAAAPNSRVAWLLSSRADLARSHRRLLGCFYSSPPPGQASCSAARQSS